MTVITQRPKYKNPQININPNFISLYSQTFQSLFQTFNKNINFLFQQKAYVNILENHDENAKKNSPHNKAWHL
jgi:hypothetical protein